MLGKSDATISKQSLLDELIYSFNDNAILSIYKKLLMKAYANKLFLNSTITYNAFFFTFST